LRHKLGLALHLSGNEAAAFREFEEAVRLAPAAGVDEPAARAHYGLGVIHAGRGRYSQIDQLIILKIQECLNFNLRSLSLKSA
jgi:hypothetical protein